MVNSIKKTKLKRSFNTVYDQAQVIEKCNEKDGVIKKIVNDVISTSTKVEMIPLSDVKLNYKNKRVITQLIRFIPDALAFEARTKPEPSKYIIANINKIPLNNIQLEINNANQGDNILEYPNHSDLYNTVKEGIFVGQGICFSNIKAIDKNLNLMIDDFVERVIRNGNSLTENKDVVEKPQIVQTGGQRFKLVFGHQRYTYLVFQYGLAHVYDFNLSLNEERQDLKIFLENNSKTTETGYEQLLSAYFTVLDLALIDREQIMLNLSISRTRYFQLQSFLEDIHLIVIVKETGINLSLKILIAAITKVKKDLKLLKITGKEELYRRFKEKLLILTINNKKPQVNKANVSLSLPNNSNLLEKLLFTDIREMDGFDINEYDLNDSKSIQKLFKKIVELSYTK